MSEKILTRFRNKIVIFILYICIGTILVPFYYHYLDIPFYYSAGLYLPFISLTLLYILKKNHNTLFVSNSLVVLAFFVQIFLLMTATSEFNKMFFFPMSIFIFYTLLDIKKASILTMVLIISIFIIEVLNGFQLGYFNFYALILSITMIAFVFTSVYILVNKLSYQANKLYKRVLYSNKVLNKKVKKRTLELTLAHKTLEHILNSHDDIVILIENNNIIMTNQKYNDYFHKDKKLSIYSLLEKNKIVLNDNITLKSNKIVDGLYTFLLNKKDIFIDNKIYTLLTLTDISEFNNQFENIKSKAYVDTLTSLNNRAMFENIINNLLISKNNQIKKFALIMFDIDNFKVINDNFGHDAGDKAIQDSANFVISNIRDEDILFRWGGDEFFLIIHSDSSDYAYNISEKLRLLFLDTQLHKKYNITLSFGITQHKKGDTIQTITKRVDEALYISKQNGKNQSNEV